jgi:hypothetical protein
MQKITLFTFAVGLVYMYTAARARILIMVITMETSTRVNPCASDRNSNAEQREGLYMGYLFLFTITASWKS